MTKETTADLIVMPRCRSSVKVSVWVFPSSTLPISSMTPAAWSSRSVRVVLPASTCATIPRFKVFTELHVLQVGGNSPLDRHESLAHLLLPGRSTVARSVAEGHLGGQPICSHNSSRSAARALALSFIAEANAVKVRSDAGSSSGSAASCFNVTKHAASYQRC